MNFFTKLFSSGIGDLFKTIMDEVKLSPEKKAELEEKHAELMAQAEQADRDLEEKLNDIAGQNIRAETSSNDSFVRRARPAFLWVMTACIALNIVLPLVNHTFGGSMQPLSIDAYLDLFKIAFLGYVTARTVEKVKNSS